MKGPVMSRFRYWIILLAEGPTTFRSRDPETLTPTLTQLRRTHPEAALKWFEAGKLWDSPEEAQAAGASPPERRARDWRPGGDHRDPKAVYKKPPRDVRKRRIIERMR
ncbi:MAG: hypothetical protein KJ061_11880, partial [Vicinamibacteraceae bacterium]|nr:hypothetical protein [Vicinamibacteraceae bacterium]